ncbi:MAG: TolC family protein [Candidatus Glassbacteria bacterium]|nr:TolC family protein [Candidatus Glassbacteria bacterium]
MSKMKNMIAAGLIAGLSSFASLLGDAPASPAGGETPGAAQIAFPLPDTVFNFLAGSAREIDQAEVVGLVLERGLVLKSARLRISEAEGVKFQAAASFIPTLSPGLYLQHTDGRVQGSFGVLRDVEFNTVSPGIFVLYGLNPAEAAYRMIAAGHSLESVRSGSRESANGSISEAASQFVDLQYAAVAVAVARELESNAGELVRISRARLLRGLGNEEDVHRSEANLARAGREVLNRQIAFENTMLLLAETLNLDPGITLVPRPASLEPLELLGKKRSQGELIEAARTTRPGLRSAQLVEAAAKAELTGERWRFLAPRFDLVYRLGTIGGQFDDQRREERLTLLASLDLSPILWGRARELKAHHELSAVNTQMVLSRLQRNVQQAYRGYLNAGNQMSLGESEIESAEAALRISNSRFTAGLGLSIEVMAAQKELAEARLGYFSAVALFNKAQIRLLYETGEIEPSVFSSP